MCRSASVLDATRRVHKGRAAESEERVSAGCQGNQEVRLMTALLKQDIFSA